MSTLAVPTDLPLFRVDCGSLTILVTEVHIRYGMPLPRAVHKVLSVFPCTSTYAPYNFGVLRSRNGHWYSPFLQGHVSPDLIVHVGSRTIIAVRGPQIDILVVQVLPYHISLYLSHIMGRGGIGRNTGARAIQAATTVPCALLL